MKTRFRLLPGGRILFLFLILAALGNPVVAPARESLLDPTPAYPVEMLYPEWAPAKAVWMSIPLNLVRDHEGKRTYFLSLLRAILPHIPVSILYDEDQEGSLLDWEEAMQADPEIAPYLEGRIDLVPSKVQSEWLRDFGPVFARGENGELVILDHRYRGLEHMKTMWKMELDSYSSLTKETFLETKEKSLLYNFFDDITPNFMAARIARQGENVELVKPPIFLSTGDLATDGQGRIFITEDTLLENGGSRAELLKRTREYYNARELHVLFATPGRSTRHLDMLFKLANPNRVLLTTTLIRNTPQTAQQKRILSAVENTLKINREYVERHLPELEIYELPLPPLLFKTREAIERKIREDVMDAVGRHAGLDMPRVRAAAPNSTLYREATAIIRKKLMGDLKLQNLDDAGWLSQATRHYLDSELETLVKGYVEAHTDYRTYANSLQIRLPDGADLVLIPRYRPREGEDPALFAKLEKQVLAAYEQAYPGARLTWIDSDAMIDFDGAVHCTTLVQPVN